MITPETRAEIFRLVRVEHQSITSTAKSLGIHHLTVKRVLENEARSPTAHRSRGSKLDPFASIILQKLEEHPQIRATALWRILKDRGYGGSAQMVRLRLSTLRGIGAKKKAFFPITAFAGDEAQVDWAHFGTMKVGRTQRKLSCFIMVLAYSRAIFARFFFDQTLDSFLTGHVEAFTYFEGVPRQIRYDNLKAAVIDRYGSLVRYNPQLLELAGFYAFKPNACNPYAGYEKGRVERAVRYIRDSFFVGRNFSTIDCLNTALDKWITDVALQRAWPDDKQRLVRDILAEEKPKLIPLNQKQFPVQVERPVRSGKIPFIRFDKNDYSIPYEYAGQQLSLIANPAEIKISARGTLIAKHMRSYSSGERIIEQKHFARLVESRPGAATVMGRAFLTKLIPQADGLLAMMAERGVSIGPATAKLLELLRIYGASIFTAAVDQANQRGYADYNYLAKVCEHLLRQSKPAKIQLPIDLPAQMPGANLHVTPHKTAAYDDIF